MLNSEPYHESVPGLLKIINCGLNYKANTIFLMSRKVTESDEKLIIRVYYLMNLFRKSIGKNLIKIIDQTCS